MIILEHVIGTCGEAHLNLKTILMFFAIYFLIKKNILLKTK